jgi:hypothetical protein
MIHNYLDESSRYLGSKPQPSAELPTHYTFNEERYELFVAQKHTYLYDRCTQDAFTISTNLRTYLRHLTTSPEKVTTVVARINANLLQDLLSKQILKGTCREESL